MIVLAVSLLAGCSIFHRNVVEPPVDGGKTDNSYSAPKEIKSENIVEFSTDFFRFDEFEREKTVSTLSA